MAQTPDSFYIIIVVNAFCHTINPSRLVKGVIACLSFKSRCIRTWISLSRIKTVKQVPDILVVYIEYEESDSHQNSKDWYSDDKPQHPWVNSFQLFFYPKTINGDFTTLACKKVKKIEFHCDEIEMYVIYGGKFFYTSIRIDNDNMITTLFLL